MPDNGAQHSERKQCDPQVSDSAQIFAACLDRVETKMKQRPYSVATLRVRAHRLEEITPGQIPAPLTRDLEIPSDIALHCNHCPFRRSDGCREDEWHPLKGSADHRFAVYWCTRHIESRAQVLGFDRGRPSGEHLALDAPNDERRRADHNKHDEQKSANVHKPP